MCSCYYKPESLDFKTLFLFYQAQTLKMLVFADYVSARYFKNPFIYSNDFVLGCIWQVSQSNEHHWIIKYKDESNRKIQEWKNIDY